MKLGKLDRLVCEFVLNWIWDNKNSEWRTGKRNTVKKNFSPSTDIGDAMIVANSFKQIRIEKNEEIDLPIKVSIWVTTAEGVSKFTSFADTLQKAICLAALRSSDKRIELNVYDLEA